MLELWGWELRTGERFEALAHPRGTFELITVTKGTLSLEVFDVAHDIEAGGSALARIDVSHAYACAGRGVVHFTMAIADWGR